MMKYFVFIYLLIAGCSTPNVANTIQKMDVDKNYKRDMVVRVNNVTREGSIAMPLLPKNVIHVWSRNDMDTFVVETCGGRFNKSKEWAVTTEVRTGFFGFGKKKIESPREVEFTIDATDFHDTGVCSLYLYAISKTDGKRSEALIMWQTPYYQAGGEVVCNMQKRPFSGVETCSIATGSFTKLIFDEEMYVSPSPGCEINNVVRDEYGNVLEVKQTASAKVFDFQVHSGTCNYVFLSKTSNKKANYNVYGEDEEIVR